MKKKKRASISAAEWSVARATSYRTMCEDIAYRGGYKIVVRDGIVYKVDTDGEVVLIRPINPKTMWFETWCALTGRIEPSEP